MRKNNLVFVIAVFGLTGCCAPCRASGKDGYRGESIEYAVRPIGGRAQYRDMGPEEIEGRKLNLVVFLTHVIGFKDIEKIYYDPETYLPLRVERDIRRLIGREQIVEEYDQKNFTVTIKKFKGRKKISEVVQKSEGVIHNAIMVCFYPRIVPDLGIGWSSVVHLPLAFKVGLVSVEKVKVPAGEFETYHFTSAPHKFEIWIDKAEPRIPVIIKGAGGFTYSMLLRKYSPAVNQ